MADQPLETPRGGDPAPDDPDLAARLTAGPGTRDRPPGRGALWLVVLGAVAAVTATFLLGPPAFGVMALLVLFGCPFAVSRWLVADPDRPGDDPPS